jgi:hypothetical protein
VLEKTRVERAKRSVVVFIVVGIVSLNRAGSKV